MCYDRSDALSVSGGLRLVCDAAAGCLNPKITAPTAAVTGAITSAFSNFSVHKKQITVR